MTVRIRGVYATALTELCRGDPDVVQASDPIRERFDEAFPDEPAAADVATTDDRRGVCVTGDAATVAAVVDRLRDEGRDALAWADPTPRGSVHLGEVTETLSGGAVVALESVDADDAAGTAEDEADADDGDSLGVPLAGTDPEGYLPYGTVDERVETGDEVRVQVAEPASPWGDDRPILDAAIRVRGSLASLVRGGASGGTGGSPSGTGPSMLDLLPTDPRDEWGVEWEHASDDADFDALDEALAALNERAARVDAALADDGAEAAGGASEAAGGPSESTDESAAPAPRLLATDEATAWVWFGRETRFALDERRRDVATTMPGHHRIKAGSRSASGAVDFAEALTADVDHAAKAFPFQVVTRQFGPQAGDAVAIRHGKPDGRAFDLGRAEVEAVDGDGTVTLRREMSPGGTYDGLGVERRAGDVATTKVKEGRWWYPTVYESADGETRGTYVNVCTPVEVFPDRVGYVDLHVDVVRHADGTVERVDDDELDEAVAAGYVPEPLAEKAREVAASVQHGLE